METAHARIAMCGPAHFVTIAQGTTTDRPVHRARRACTGLASPGSAAAALVAQVGTEACATSALLVISEPIARLAKCAQTGSATRATTAPACALLAGLAPNAALVTSNTTAPRAVRVVCVLTAYVIRESLAIAPAVTAGTERSVMSAPLATMGAPVFRAACA